jgi:hypothetical protein
VDSAAADTSAPAVIQPTSAREAEALGLKLVGVYDSRTGEWIQRATLRDTLGTETVTSSIGVATLNVFAPVAGYYMLEARKEGYAPKRFNLPANKGSEFLVAMDPRPLGSATELPAVVINAKASLLADPGLASGFFHRCELGAKCVSRAVLGRRPTAGIAEFLSQTPGVHRTCNSASPLGPNANARALDQLNGSVTYTSPSGPPCKVEMLESTATDIKHPWCVPSFFVNGFPWSSNGGTGGAQDQIDAFLGATDIAGIEVYLNSEATPPRFVIPASKCGAVVIWTR